MTVHKLTPVLNVSSVSDSLSWFEKLGWKRGFTWNESGFMGSGPEARTANAHGGATFASVCSGAAEIFLCHGAQGSRGTVMPRFPGDDVTDGVWMSWWMSSTDEVDALHAVALKHGMIVTFPPTNKPWGLREFHLRHPDGHMFRVSAGTGKPG